MTSFLTWLLAGFICVAPTVVMAQEDGPSIIPARLQEIARELPIAERLGIVWKDATPEDVGRYMGIVAASYEVAKEIASKNGREAPDDKDYLAAMSAFCFFPNKPPLVESYWPRTYSAFYSTYTRMSLSDAVGPAAVELAEKFTFYPSTENMALAQEIDVDSIVEDLPTSEGEYLSDVLNLQNLPPVE